MNTDILLERLNQIQSKFVDDWSKPLTVDEAKDYLQISKSTLYKLTYQRRIPFFKPNGKKIYFHRKDLDAWIAGARISSQTEVQEKANQYLLKNSNKR